MLSKLKKIEFRGYFIHALVLQGKIKAWGWMIIASEPSLIANILCWVLTCVSIKIVNLPTRLLWREWLIQESGLWIKPHQFKNNRLTTSAFVWRGRLVYATICDKSDCFGSTLLFFFVEPIRSKYPRNSIFF